MSHGYHAKKIKKQNKYSAMENVDDLKIRIIINGWFKRK